MIASRFRPVGWVAAVAIAALGCYLVSLRVATKRGEVASVEAQILSTRQDMRQLETELGTRSRLVQLERWNSQVLALTAPRVGQYLTSPMELASLGALPDTPGTPSAVTPGDGTVLQATYQPPTVAAGTAVKTVAAAAPAPSAPPVVRKVVAKVKPEHHAKVELVAADARRPHVVHAVVKATVKPAHRPHVELTSASAGAARAHLTHVVAKVTVKPAGRPHIELASSSDDDAPALLHRTSYVKMGAGHASARQVALLDDSALGAIERAARSETGEGKKQRR